MHSDVQLSLLSDRPTTRPVTEVVPAALQAFHGAGNAKRANLQDEVTLADKLETRRKNTAKSMIAPGTRKQEIYTPPELIEAINKVWPHIALDPCSGPESTVGALRSYYTPPSVVLTPTGKQKIVYIPVGGDCVDGLTASWEDYTFANPPYKLLKDWMLKGHAEGHIQEREVMMLVPARGHRTWFRDVVATCSEVCDLNPVKFVGYKSAFPAPLLMIYFGAFREMFKEAFSGKLGDCR